MKAPLCLCVGSMLVGLALITPTKAQAQASPERAFNELFRDDLRAVRRTKETEDDAAFAQRMLREAQSKKHEPGLTVYLYERAYEYGLRDPKGYATADHALDDLLKGDDSRTREIATMRLGLFEKWHEVEAERYADDFEALIDHGLRLSQEAAETGDFNWALKFLNRVNRFATRIKSPRQDDVRDSLSGLIRHRKTLEEIAELEEKLETDPAAADELAMLYLADLDDPDKASLYAHQMEDLQLASKVLVAATEFKLAEPKAASEAGAFYLSLVTESKSRQPVAMLIRGRVWLTEYLSREVGEPEDIKAALDMIGEIDAELLTRGVGKKLRRKMSSLVRGEGQFDRPAEIQAAIDKGVKWLYEQHNDKTHWDNDAQNHRNYGGYTALVVYALLMADEEPQLNGDLSRAVHFMMNADMKGTYALCFRIHAWEVMPRRERYRQTLTRDVTRLRGGATRHGFWGYTMKGDDVKPGSKLDLSTTLAGGLGLWIGEAVGGITAQKIYWERTARGLIDVQLDDNGWSYNPAVDQTSQGAMTAGSLALLYAARPHLNEATKAKADEAIEKGMQWMDENFSPTTNVNRGNRFNNYYFAAIQHAGLFSGRRDFRNQDWYGTIAAHLVKTQSANGAMGSVEETAFAVAFLCRGGIVYEPSAADLGLPDVDDESSSIESDNTPAPEAEPAVPTQLPAE